MVSLIFLREVDFVFCILQFFFHFIASISFAQFFRRFNALLPLISPNSMFLFQFACHSVSPTRLPNSSLFSFLPSFLLSSFPSLFFRWFSTWFCRCVSLHRRWVKKQKLAKRETEIVHELEKQKLNERKIGERMKNERWKEDRQIDCLKRKRGIESRKSNGTERLESMENGGE